MLTYILLEINGDEYIYIYYPDGNEDAPGKVSLSKNGDKRIIEESVQDFGKRYAYHALKGIDLSKKVELLHGINFKPEYMKKEK